MSSWVRYFGQQNDGAPSECVYLIGTRINAEFSKHA
jgi:hypothetical protein